MVQIELLKNHSQHIKRLADIWCEVLGKIWLPDFQIEKVIKNFENHLNSETLPLTYVALDQEKPIGMASLRANDGIRPDLSPWLGSLVVDPAFQKRGVGELLINAIKHKAKTMGFHKLYLFAFDPTIPDWYEKLGWKKIGDDHFKQYPVIVMEIAL